MKCNCMYGKCIVDLVLCYETKIKHRRVIVSGFNVQLWYSVEGKFHILHTVDLENFGVKKTS